MAAAGGAALTLFGVIMSGSLAAILLALIGIATSVLLLIPNVSKAVRWGGIFVVVCGVLAAILIGVLGTNLPGLGRTGLGGEGLSRLSMWRTTLAAISDFWITGSGMGSFRDVFPIYEDAASVNNVYAPHAHNDLLELCLTGGVAGMTLLIVFVWWYANRFGTLWIRSRKRDTLAQAASIAVLILLLASLVDYPMRTQAGAVFFAMCCALMAREPKKQTETSSGDANLVPKGRHLSAD